MKVAIIVLALASVVAANRYAKPSYGHGQSNYGHSAATYQTDYVHSPHYDFDWRVKDDYYYTDFGQQETRYGYDTEGEFDTTYTGYDNYPVGHQKVEYVVESHPVQTVSSYGGYGHDNKGYNKPSYGHGHGGYNKKNTYGHGARGGYSNKGYKSRY